MKKITILLCLIGVSIWAGKVHVLEQVSGKVMATMKKACDLDQIGEEKKSKKEFSKVIKYLGGKVAHGRWVKFNNQCPLKLLIKNDEHIEFETDCLSGNSKYWKDIYWEKGIIKREQFKNINPGDSFVAELKFSKLNKYVMITCYDKNYFNNLLYIKYVKNIKKL